jgi:hypothetical protein
MVNYGVSRGCETCKKRRKKVCYPLLNCYESVFINVAIAVRRSASCEYQVLRLNVHNFSAICVDCLSTQRALSRRTYRL